MFKSSASPRGDELNKMSSKKRDPSYLEELEQRAAALRKDKATGQPIAHVASCAKPVVSKAAGEIRRLETVLKKKSTLDCPHSETQQFTEMCMSCWRNIYTPDEEHLKSLQAEYDRRVSELERELNINQPDYW